MSRLRIGFIVDDTLDSTAGVQQFTLTLGRELTRRGHYVRYITSSSSADHTDAQQIINLSSLMLVRINGNRVGTPKPASRKAIQKMLDANNFDVLHVTTPYSPLLAGRVLSRSAAAKVGTFHIAVDTWPARIGSYIAGLAQKGSLGRLDFITAVSEPAAEYAKKYYGVTPEELTPNPINKHLFHTHAASPSKNNRHKIVFLGRLVERKGAHHLIEALALLPKPILAKLEVEIGGSGPLLSKITAQIEQRSLVDVVSCIGFVPESEKAAFLASADIAVFPSTSGECFGISLLEGMAVGKTVVLGGNNPGYRSVLGSGPGSLFDPYSPTELAALITKVIQEEDFRLELLGWQESTIQQYEVATIADQFSDIYLQAIERAAKDGLS